MSSNGPVERAGERDGLLVLVPTDQERQQLARLDRALAPKLCGFGVAAAAVETMYWLQAVAPARVILVGIAGTYDPQRLPVGSACSFSRVACYGIGAGEGSRWLSPRQLEIPQLHTDQGEVFDELPLQPLPESRGWLLTVTAAAGDPRQVRARCTRFPEALAEDMEGFGVALACRRMGVPLTVVRGISNVAGDRNRDHWEIEAALHSAEQRVLSALV